MDLTIPPSLHLGLRRGAQAATGLQHLNVGDLVRYYVSHTCMGPNDGGGGGDTTPGCLALAQ